MANLVTVKEVAQVAEVSIGTVSRVFNNHQNVNEQTKQKVLRVAAQLGYTGSNRQGSTVRNGNRNLKEIGFLLHNGSSPDGEDFSGQSDPFWSAILHGVENEADRSNLRVIYKQITRLTATPRLLLNTIYEMRLGGILLVGPVEAETVKLLAQTEFPMVLVDNYVPKLGLDSILCDNLQGAKDGIEYLIEQGHRKIALITGPTYTKGNRVINTKYTLEQRVEGYRQALAEANLPFDPDLCEGTNNPADDGYEACKRLLARRTDFSALFCVNDPIAITAMRALREAGLTIPKDVSVVGFDDISLAEHLNPPLATVRVEKEAMGVSAVRALLERVAEPSRPNQTITLGGRLIKRDSVSAVRAH